MPERYPGYDVLRKRDTASWNDATRSVVDARLAIPDTRRFFNAREWKTLRAVCDRIVPQSGARAAVPIAALVDRKMAGDDREGYRIASLPPMQEAWRRGLAALEAEAVARHARRFPMLPSAQQDELLHAMQDGNLAASEWGGMPADEFFSRRLAHDIVSAYYAHPVAWSEIGFGGPASPRGYVRMYFNRHDPWEATEAHPGEEEKARDANEHVG